MIYSLSRDLDYEYISTEHKRKACAEYIKNNSPAVLKLLMPEAEDIDKIFKVTGERIIVKLEWFAALQSYPEELVLPDFVTEVE